MSFARRGIVGDDVAEEGLSVPVDAGLPPRQGSQHDERDRGNACSDVSPRPRQPRRPMRCGAHDHRDQPDAGQILVAVRDEGELHVAEVHEAEHRRQGGREEQRAGQRSAPDPLPQHPEPRGQHDGGRERAPRPRVRDAHLPMRIDDGQVRRPQQLPRVEPQRLRRDERPFDHRVVEGDGFPGRGEQHVRGCGGHSDRKEREQPEQIRAGAACERCPFPLFRGGHAPLLPPVPDQQGRGQRDHDGLAQQPQPEQRECQAIPPRPAPCVWRLHVAHPGRKRREIPQPRQHVLALHDPGDGLHVQGMDGEYRGDQPCAGEGQACPQAPQQQRVDQVQQHVDDVIAGRGEAPQFVLQPEGGVHERPIVGLVPDLRGREPDPPQAGPIADRGRLGEDPVVPDETGEEGGNVAADHQQTEGNAGKNLPASERLRGSGPRPGVAGVRRPRRRRDRCGALRSSVPFSSARPAHPSILPVADDDVVAPATRGNPQSSSATATEWQEPRRTTEAKSKENGAVRSVNRRWGCRAEQGAGKAVVSRVEISSHSETRSGGRLSRRAKGRDN